LSHLGATGSTQAMFSINMNEPPGTASTDVTAFWEHIIAGVTADGLPNQKMRLFEISNADQFAVYNVYGGISSGHAGTTANYQLELRHDHGNISGAESQFSNDDDMVATFNEYSRHTIHGGGCGGGDPGTIGGLFYYNWTQWGTDAACAAGTTIAGLDDDFINNNPLSGSATAPPNAAQAWQFAYKNASEGTPIPRVYGPTGASGHNTQIGGTDKYWTSHFRVSKIDSFGNDLHAWLQSDAINSSGFCTVRLYVLDGAAWEGPTSPSYVKNRLGGYVEFTINNGDANYPGGIGYFDGNDEIGITAGEITKQFAGPCPTPAASADNFAEYINQLVSDDLCDNSPGTVHGADIAGQNVHIPIAIQFVFNELPYAGGNGVANSCVYSDGDSWVSGAELGNLADVSSSITSQVTAALSNPKGDIQRSMVLQYDGTEFAALESGIQTRVTVPFRIESDVPIVAGDEKILRTIPFESFIDSCTLFIPEGVASGSVIIGLDKYDPGASYPTAAAKTDMIGTLPTNQFSVSTSGNTYYNGLTYGDMRNAAATWDDPGLSAGSILSINVNANTANVNTIIGDIVLVRLS